MLPPAYNWIETERGAFLRFNYGMMASVKPLNGRYEVTIYWRDDQHGGAVGSIAQGKRFIERWVAKRRGLPKNRGGAR